MAADSIPIMITNGMIGTASDTEVNCMLTFNDRPLAQVTMSPIIAKTFAQILSNLVEKYESETGLTVPSLDELKAARESRAAAIKSGSSSEL